MQRIIALFLLIVVGTQTTLPAQQEQQKRKTAEQRTDLVTQKMTDELKLSVEQQSQVYDFVLKRERLRDAGRLPKDSREQIVADIKKVLTPNQRKQWAEMRRQAKEKYRNQQQSQAKPEPGEDTGEIN